MSGARLFAVAVAAALAVGAGGAARAGIVHQGDLERGEFSAAELAFDATVADGSERYLLVSVTSQGGAVVRSVSWAGAPLGFIGAAASPGNNCRIEWWGLVAPTVGTGPFRLTSSAPSYHLAATLVVYQGVAQLASVAGFAPANGAAGPSQITIPSAAGEVVLDGVCGWAPDSVIDMAGPEQVARWHWSTGLVSSAGSEKAGAPSVTLSWSPSGPGTMEWAAAAVALRPAAGRHAVRLDVETSGCRLGGAASRPAPPALGVIVLLLLLGIVVARRGGSGGATGGANDSTAPGTSVQGSRETSTSMYPSRSVSAPVPAHADTDGDLEDGILARAKAGDRAAQAAIVHRYERPVFALLWRMLGPQRALVEDLTQETFLRVLRALSRFEDDGRARMVTWILSIAARLALDHIRACRPRTDAALAPGAIPVALPQPDQEATRRALALALFHAVERLAPPFKAAFLLREVHGLSYEEISLALSIDVGTVKSRLARARAALQAALVEMRDG